MRTRRRHRAARRLQGWWRRNLSLPVRDPISHGLLRRPVVVLAGTIFGARALRAYIEATGDFLHPITREPIDEEGMRHLERATGRCINVSRLRARARHRAEAASLRVALEADVLRVLHDLLGELGGEDTSTVVYRRLLQHFPVYTRAVTRLHGVDVEAAEFVLRRSQVLIRRARPKRRIATWMLVRDYVEDLVRAL